MYKNLKGLLFVAMAPWAIEEDKKTLGITMYKLCIRI